MHRICGFGCNRFADCCTHSLWCNQTDRSKRHCGSISWRVSYSRKSFIRLLNSNCFRLFFFSTKKTFNSDGKPVTLDDFLYNRYYARHNNATWISDTLLLHKDRSVSRYYVSIQIKSH